VKTWVLLTAALAGCAGPRVNMPAFVPDPSQQVKLVIDPRLLEPCPPLPEDVKIVEIEDILVVKAQEAKLYAQCRARHGELSDLVRKELQK